MSIFPSKDITGNVKVLTIHYNENKTNSSRTGYFTFYIDGKSNTSIKVTQETSLLSTFSLDAKGVSHLFWPFYNENDKESSNPKSTWSERSGWMSGREWEKEHTGDNQWGSYWGVDYHIGKDYFADDWNNHSHEDNGMGFYAPLSGNVIKSYYSDSYGNTIVIQSDIDNKFAFLIAHLNSRIVQVGSYVKAGDKIGTIGSTGPSSTGSHAHCALYSDIPSPFSFSMNIDNASKFEFDAISGGSGGDELYDSSNYGFTKTGLFFIAKEIIDRLNGLSVIVEYWNFKKQIWSNTNEMSLEGNYYIFQSDDIRDDYRDYCFHIETESSDQKWIPAAIKDLILNQDEVIENLSKDGYNFYTKPVDNLPIITSSESNQIRESKKDEYLIYPNPAKETINISSHSANNSYYIQLFDITGNLVLATETDGNSNINISNLKSGIYIVKIIVDNKTHYDKLIIE